MTKQGRTYLFFACAFLFLLAAPSVILYSQGYRFDLEKGRIVKTGAFYFKIAPRGAKILIDNKLVKKTDFFFGSAFIENLIPRKYSIEITRPEYQPWIKNLEIQEALVTESKNIVLVPESLRLEALENNIESFFFSSSENAIILKEEVLEKGQKTWGLKLYNTQEKIKSHIINAEDISKEKVILLDLIWSEAENRIILKTEISAQKRHFLLDLTKNPATIKALNPIEEIIENFIWHPTDSAQILVEKKQGTMISLFTRNIEQENETKILENILAYKISGQDIFWLTEDGTLQKSDLFGKSQKISFEPMPLKEQATYQLDIFNSVIFLREDDALFLFRENSKKFEQISNKIKSIRISPDSQKICFWNDSEIWVFFITQDTTQSQIKSQEKLFLTRFSKKIEQVFWWTDHYLIFNMDSKIKIIEIDDRDKAQIWDLGEFESPQIYWAQEYGKLYILDKNELMASEEL